jgi:WD40 repeat protein/serine/threonine protein kinase
MKQPPLTTTAGLAEELARYPLLTPGQLAELARSLKASVPQPRAFLADLLRRGWLTAFQINQLAHGQAAELVLGPYLLLDRLGAGGMGQVYRARHLRLDRIEAVKIIRPELLTSPGVLQRFQREARAAAQLSHVNIVAVRHADEVAGKHFLVMEYVEGTDLGDRVRKGGPLSAGHACDLIRQAALGLQHAHERRLVHRDIKPSNLLLAQEETLVKVADLGLALWRAEGPGQEASQLSVEGTALGTLDFMAPEQGVDAHRVDIRADIYSLGCTLYYLLTGRVVFPGGTAVQKLLRHQQAEPESVERLCPDLPAGVPPVLGCMLAKDPAARFQTPAEVAAALAPFSDQAGSRSVRRPVQREPAPVAETNTKGEQTTTGWRSAPTLPPAGSPGKDATAPCLVPGDTPAASHTAPDLQTCTMPAPRSMRRVVLLAAGLALCAGLAWYLWPRSEGKRREDIEVTTASPLDRLDAGAIPATERFPWQPSELVGVVGTHSWRHWGPVRGVAVSPDGRLVASSSEDGRILLREIATGKLLATVTGHKDTVYGVAFDPMGRFLASAGHDQTVRLWNQATGEQAAILEGHASTVNAVAVSPNGKLLGAGSSSDDTSRGEIRLWNLETRKPHRTLQGHAREVTAVAFSPDGTLLASASKDGMVQLWDARTGDRGRTLRQKGETMLAVAFAPNGQEVAAGCEDASVTVWSVASGAERASLKADWGGIHALAYLPDGTLAAAGADRVIRLWDVGQKKVRAELKGHAEAVNALAVGGEGPLLVSGSSDQAVKLWDLASSTERPLTQGGILGPVHALAFAPDGSGLACAGSEPLLWSWDAAGPSLGAFKGKERFAFHSLAFAPDGRTIATGGYDDFVLLWDVAGRQERKTFRSRGYIYALAYSPDGQTLAVGGEQRCILWDAAGTREQASLPGHRGFVWGIAFAPDGRTLATVDGDHEQAGEVKLWNGVTGAAPVLLKGHAGMITAVAWSPDGRTLFTASADRTVKQWDVADRKERATWTGHQEKVTSVALAPNGKVAASSDEAGSVILWDVSTGDKMHDWKLPGSVEHVVFAPDGRHLALGNSNGTVYLLRVGALLATRPH